MQVGMKKGTVKCVIPQRIQGLPDTFHEEVLYHQ